MGASETVSASAANFREGLGDRITECAEKFRWSAVSLAGQLGIESRTMSRYRLGETVPKLELLAQIAKVAKVRFEWLAINEGPRDIADSGHIVLESSEWKSVHLLDPRGNWSYNNVCAYTKRSCMTNLWQVADESIALRLVHLGAFRVTESFHGQRYTAGDWVLVAINLNALASGWFCIKGPSENAFVREITIDDEGAINVWWPRAGCSGELKKYSPAEFGVRFSVIGRVLGPFSMP